jgi:hypothetical protein
MQLAREFRPDLHDLARAESLRKANGLGNFMTPEIVAVFGCPHCRKTFEVSAGEWLGKRIFGVSMYGPGMRKPEPDKSAGGFYSLAECWDLISSVCADFKDREALQ